MIRIGLYSEDRTLHPLLSSVLGKDFQVLLESDEEGMENLVNAGECDVMILDLNSHHGSLNERIEFSRAPDLLPCSFGHHGRRRTALDGL